MARVCALAGRAAIDAVTERSGLVVRLRGWRSCWMACWRNCTSRASAAPHACRAILGMASHIHTHAGRQQRLAPRSSWMEIAAGSRAASLLPARLQTEEKASHAMHNDTILRSGSTETNRSGCRPQRAEQAPLFAATRHDALKRRPACY